MSPKNLLPRPAMIVAVVALIAALGGSAYAAAKIGTEDLKRNAVTSPKVAPDSLRGKDFKQGALKSSDIADGTVKQRDLNENLVSSLKPRWLLIDEQGQIEEQSGGFTVVDGYQTNDNVYVDAGSSLSGHGLTATIALQNQVDVDGAAGADPSFDGQVSIARCQTAAVDCAPQGAKSENAFVVAPRNADGSATDAQTRKRVYVQVTP